MWYRVYGISFDIHNLVTLVPQIEVDQGVYQGDQRCWLLDTNLLVITPRA